MKEPRRTTRGQFKNGTSGNPAGRPAGSRNKATLACEQLLEGQAERLTTKLLEMALKGNIHAMRMCMDRTVPARKERCINLDLRPISSVQDLPIHFQDITSAVAEGRITPNEGESLSNILTSHAQTMDRVNTDRRLTELEAQLPAMESSRREMRMMAEERIRQDAERNKGAAR